MHQKFHRQDQICRVRQIIITVLSVVRALDSRVNVAFEQSEAFQDLEMQPQSQVCLQQAEDIYGQINELYSIEEQLNSFVDVLYSMGQEELSQSTKIIDDFKLIFEQLLSEQRISEAIQLFRSCSACFMRSCQQSEADSSDL